MRAWDPTQLALLRHALADASKRGDLAYSAGIENPRVQVEYANDRIRLNFRLPRVNGHVEVSKEALEAATTTEQVQAIVDEAVFDGGKKTRGRALVNLLNSDFEIADSVPWERLERAAVILMERCDELRRTQPGPIVRPSISSSKPPGPPLPAIADPQKPTP